MERSLFEELQKSKYLINVEFQSSKGVISVIGEILKVLDDYIVLRSSSRTSYLSMKIIVQVAESRILKATNEQEMVSEMFRGNSKKSEGDD